MKKITNKGNLPPPLQHSGLLSEEMYNRVWSTYGEPEIWECNKVDEVGILGHLDECEFQVLIDKGRNRYYLVAMSADPDRSKGKIDTTEDGEIVIDPDESPKPVTVVYYTEITRPEYLVWCAADTAMRRGYTVTWGDIKKQLREVEKGVDRTGIRAKGASEEKTSPGDERE